MFIALLVIQVLILFIPQASFPRSDGPRYLRWVAELRPTLGQWLTPLSSAGLLTLSLASDPGGTGNPAEPAGLRYAGRCDRRNGGGCGTRGVRDVELQSGGQRETRDVMACLDSSGDRARHSRRMFGELRFHALPCRTAAMETSARL